MTPFVSRTGTLHNPLASALSVAQPYSIHSWEAC